MIRVACLACFGMLPMQHCLLPRIYVRLGWFYKPLIMSREMLAGLRCLSKALNASSNEALLFSRAVNTLFLNWGLVSTQNKCTTFHDLLHKFYNNISVNNNWNIESTPTSREVKNGRTIKRLPSVVYSRMRTSVKIFVCAKTFLLEIDVRITGNKGSKIRENFCRLPSVEWTKLLKSLLTLVSVHGVGNAWWPEKLHHTTANIRWLHNALPKI